MKNTLKIMLILGVALLYTSCTSGDYDCEGEIIVENEIPDITLELGGEPFRRDVFEEPVVFRHTDGKHITITPRSENIAIVITKDQKNPQTGEFSIIEVIPNSVGTTLVQIIAAEECPEYEKTTSFQVTVTDSISSD